MILEVDPSKKKQLLNKVKQLKQKGSAIYYINRFCLPVIIPLSIVLLVVLRIWCYSISIIAIILSLITFCVLAKFFTYVLNTKYSTEGFCDLSYESLSLDDECLIYSRHSIEIGDEGSVWVSTIYLKDIQKCEYDPVTEEVTIHANYSTVDYVGNTPVNYFEDGPTLSIYDYYEPSLYQMLIIKNFLITEVKN